MLKDIEINKSTICFKVKFVKLLAKYPKHKKSSLFLKNYMKFIKQVCKESGNEFK